jgi:hypothetical protein
MKAAVLWDVILLSLIEVYERFGKTYCLHLQRRRVNQSGNKAEANSSTSLLVVSGLLFA